MGGLDLPKADCAAFACVLSARGAGDRPREVRGGQQGGKLCNLHLLASEGAGVEGGLSMELTFQCLMLRHAESAPAEEVGDTLKPPRALRRMFPESRMREIRPSGLMRGGSWLTHLGQLLLTLPPWARLLGAALVLD